MKLGDVVQLKGSTMQMTIVRIRDEEAVCAYDKMDLIGIQLEYKSFPIRALKLYNTGANNE